MDWRKLLLSPNGRIGRQAYWTCVFLGAIALAVTNTLDIFIFGAISGTGPVSTLAVLTAIFPAICVQSKRLHDLGRSAWLLLAPYGLAVATMLPIGGESVAQLFSLMTLGVATAFTVWLGFFRGSAAANRFGEPPSGGLAPPAETFT